MNTFEKQSRFRQSHFKSKSPSSILKRQWNQRTTPTYWMIQSPPHSTHNKFINSVVFVILTACKQIDFGVQAIFGPSDPLLGPHVQSICDALDIPHLETRLDMESRSPNKELSINLHPSQETLILAYKDLMRFLNWTKVAIIYEDEGGTLQFSIIQQLLVRNNSFRFSREDIARLSSGFSVWGIFPIEIDLFRCDEVN